MPPKEVLLWVGVCEVTNMLENMICLTDLLHVTIRSSGVHHLDKDSRFTLPEATRYMVSIETFFLFPASLIPQYSFYTLFMFNSYHSRLSHLFSSAFSVLNVPTIRSSGCYCLSDHGLLYICVRARAHTHTHIPDAMMFMGWKLLACIILH